MHLHFDGFVGNQRLGGIDVSTMTLGARSRWILAGVAGINLLILWFILAKREFIISNIKQLELEGLDKPVESSSTPTRRHTISEDNKAQLQRFGVSRLKRIFRPVINPDEKKQIMKAVEVLTDELDRIGIDYFVYGGSLIGSWRHHDIVPWDDDIDIIVNISSWRNLEALQIPGYTMDTHPQNRYKFYSNDATNVPGYFWKWPHIDVCLFGDNGTHLYDIDPTFSKTFVYDKNDVLPLVRRPFGNLNLKCPRDTEKILEQNYSLKECQTRAFDHQSEKPLHIKNMTTVDCKLLYRIYPFVIRRELSMRNKYESLYLDSKLQRVINLAELENK